MQSTAPLTGIPQYKDFRMFLQADLARRCRSNPRYSLRSYAMFLGVSPSFLSHLLHGKRPVTRATLDKLSKKIGMDPKTIDGFVRYHFENHDQEKSSAVRMMELTMDKFQIISDWYHYAILELTLVDGFCPQAKWVAKSLGITVSEVHAAVERLQRVGLLTLTEAGHWVVNPEGNTTIGNDYSNMALRHLQRQVLEKSIVALETQPIEQRDHSSVTMAVDSSLMPELKSCIKAFRRQMIGFQEKSAKKDQIYHLSVSIYPVLEKINQEKNL